MRLWAVIGVILLFVRSADAWQLQVRFNIRYPIHETITRQAFGRLCESATIGGICQPKGEKLAMQGVCGSASRGICRGIFWNDDPQSYIFEPNKEDEYRANWYGKFTKDNYDELAKKYRKNPDALQIGSGWQLIARTHWGDLAFLHSMRAKSYEPPGETKKKVLIWARFALMVWSGEIGPNTPLANVSLEGFELLGRDTGNNWNGCESPHSKDKAACSLNKSLTGLAVSKALKDITVQELFCFPSIQCDYKGRAFGTLLHMVQDSYSPAHTDRRTAGAIAEFYYYLTQDGCHAALDSKDVWEVTKECPKNVRDDLWRAVVDPDQEVEFPGYREAINQSKKILELSQKGDASAKILKYLDERTYKLYQPLEDAVSQVVATPIIGDKERDEQLKRLQRELAQLRLQLTQVQRERRRAAAQLKPIQEKLARLKTQLELAQLDKKRLELQEAIGQGAGCTMSPDSEDGSLHIICPDELKFDSGQRSPDEKAKSAIRRVVEPLKKSGFLSALQQSKRKIQIIGHTDDRKPELNWGLSAERSLKVLRYVTANKIIPEEVLSVCGHGQFSPIDPNNTKEARERNRRVEIIIQPDLKKWNGLLKEYAKLYQNLIKILAETGGSPLQQSSAP